MPSQNLDLELQIFYPSPAQVGRLSAYLLIDKTPVVVISRDTNLLNGPELISTSARRSSDIQCSDNSGTYSAVIAFSSLDQVQDFIVLLVH